MRRAAGPAGRFADLGKPGFHVVEVASQSDGSRAGSPRLATRGDYAAHILRYGRWGDALPRFESILGRLAAKIQSVI
jgi:hypothetical protein